MLSSSTHLLPNTIHNNFLPTVSFQPISLSLLHHQGNPKSWFLLPISSEEVYQINRKKFQSQLHITSVISPSLLRTDAILPMRLLLKITFVPTSLHVAPVISGFPIGLANLGGWFFPHVIEIPGDQIKIFWIAFSNSHMEIDTDFWRFWANPRMLATLLSKWVH